jgi:hypothetical protein
MHPDPRDDLALPGRVGPEYGTATEAFVPVPNLKKGLPTPCSKLE